MLKFETSAEVFIIQFKYFSGILVLSQILRYFRGSRFSQCFIKNLSIACYQVIFYAKNYLVLIPIVSCAFKSLNACNLLPGRNYIWHMELFGIKCRCTWQFKNRLCSRRVVKCVLQEGFRKKYTLLLNIKENKKPYKCNRC